MNEAEEIGIAIAVIIAASLALQSALGPAMNALVEAIKSAGLVQEGKGGLVSLGVGTALGSAAGLIAVIQSPQHDPLWIGVGAFAGLIGLGTGGVRSHMVVRGMQQTATDAAANAPRQVAPVVNGHEEAAGERVANLYGGRARP